jgi:protein-S-isoprenylcysteine O-methyltransferase Ste14
VSKLQRSSAGEDRRGASPSKFARFFGVGPLVFGPAFAYGAVAIVLTWLWPAWFWLQLGPPWLWWIIGGVMLAGGQVVYVLWLPSLRRAIRKGELLTTGLYRCCRHPLYAAWILLGLPGIALLFRSWLALGMPVLAAVLFGVFIGREEAAMERRFGEAYRAYKRRTPALLPWVGRDRGGP